jgi:hypothetical protein
MEYALYAGGLFVTKMVWDYYGSPGTTIEQRHNNVALMTELQTFDKQKMKKVTIENNNHKFMSELEIALKNKFSNC